MIEVFLSFLDLNIIMLMVAGVAIGILGGALPGISTTMTVALVATACYTMNTLDAIAFLMATQIGSTYGGSISATVLNIPGTPAGAATAIEGYALGKKGKAKLALGVNVFSSFMGNMIGLVLLLVLMPVLLTLAMKFGPWELFWFALFGLVICARLSRANFLKGLMAACMGLLFAFVGMDMIHGIVRYSLGIYYLRDGIGLIPAMVGLYGMSEVFPNLIDYQVKTLQLDDDRRMFYIKEWWQYKWLSVKSAVLGFLIGVVPGIGANIACWVGYDHAMATSKKPEDFGTGVVEGLVGSETANNACVPGAIAPLLSLGVPGDAVGAVILGVFIVQGVSIGPSFLGQNPQYLYLVSFAIFFSGIMFLLIGTYVGRAILKVLTIPLPIIMSAVAVLCVVGAFSTNNRFGDIAVMFFFGLLGLVMKKFKFPIAPMILGLVIGGTLIDANFRRALLAGKGSFLPFFTRPISVALIVVLMFVIFNEIMSARKRSRGAHRPKSDTTD